MSDIQWHLNQKAMILILESAFENAVYEIVAILSRLQCVKTHVIFGVCVLFSTIYNTSITCLRISVAINGIWYYF